MSEGVTADLLDQDGRTPLLRAAMYGRDTVAASLLKAKADVSRLNPLDGCQALHYAAQTGSAKVRPHVCPPVVGLGLAVVHQAPSCPHHQVLQALLPGVSDVDARNNRNETALLLAAGGGHLEVVQLLLGHSADPNLADVDLDTPLHRAAKNGHTHGEVK